VGKTGLIIDAYETWNLCSIGRMRAEFVGQLRADAKAIERAV
jgi:hypothetical protein